LLCKQAEPQGDVDQAAVGLGSMMPPLRPFVQPRASVPVPQLAPEQACSVSILNVQLLLDQARAHAPLSEQSVVPRVAAVQLPPREQLGAVAPMLQPSAVPDVPDVQLRPLDQRGPSTLLPQPAAEMRVPLVQQASHDQPGTFAPFPQLSAGPVVPIVQQMSRDQPGACAPLSQPSERATVQMMPRDQNGAGVRLAQLSTRTQLPAGTSRATSQPCARLAEGACVVQPIQRELAEVVDDREIEESTDDLYGFLSNINKGRIQAVADEAQLFARPAPLSRTAGKLRASSLGEPASSSDACCFSEGASSPSSPDGAQSWGSDVAGGPTPGNNGRGKPPPRSPGGHGSSSPCGLHMASQTDAFDLHGETAVLPSEVSTVKVRLSQRGPNFTRLASPPQILRSEMGNMNYQELKADDDELPKAFLFQQLERCQHRKSLGIVTGKEHSAYSIDYGASECGFEKSVWLRTTGVVPASLKISQDECPGMRLFEHTVALGSSGHFQHKFVLRDFFMSSGLYSEEPTHYETCFGENAMTLMLKFGPSIVAAMTVRLFKTVGGDIGSHVELFACNKAAYARALAHTHREQYSG
jgi:hypothetical protein